VVVGSVVLELVGSKVLELVLELVLAEVQWVAVAG
jgi:hypothetical protein